MAGGPLVGRPDPTESAADDRTFPHLREASYGRTLVFGMLLLPVYCEACARASLVSPAEREHGLVCPSCTAAVRVVPGPAYRETDRSAFEEIEAAVSGARLGGAEAYILAEALREMLRGEYVSELVVARAIERLPSLAAARATLSRYPRHGVGMLMTILSARSRDAPRRSGEYPASPSPPSGQGQHATAASERVSLRNMRLLLDGFPRIRL